MRNVQFQLELKDHIKQFTIKKYFSDWVSIHSNLNSVNLGNLSFLYQLLSLTSKVKLSRIRKNSLTVMQDVLAKSVDSFIKNMNRRLCCRHFSFLTQPPISEIGAGEK